MDENRFFKWIWRLDSLIILALLFGVVFEIYSNQFRRPDYSLGKREIISSVAEDPEGKENWFLGYPTQINGSEYLLLPLESENKEAKAEGGIRVASVGISVRRHQAKNILFINPISNESHWLFKDTARLILSTEEFPYSYPKDSNVPTKIIFYELIIVDSNQDGILNDKDKPSLAFSSPEGKGYQVVINEFDRIIGKTMVDEDKILIVFQQNGVGYSMLFRLDPYEILSKIEIPKIENS